MMGFPSAQPGCCRSPQNRTRRLRALAGRYVAWLEERESAPASEDAARDPALADMAWTAGVGRSHFRHRAAVVFEDGRSLRAGLRACAEAGGRPGAPETVAKVALAYPGSGTGWAGLGEVLYECEPVVRGCSRPLRRDCWAKYGARRCWTRSSAGPVRRGIWTIRSGSRPAVYALECALTALWSSVGVRPSVAIGHGVGELAAAQAAGVLDLGDGLRLAASLSNLGAVSDGVAMGSPSLTLVSGASGRAVANDETQDAAYWHQRGNKRSCGVRDLDRKRWRGWASMRSSRSARIRRWAQRWRQRGRKRSETPPRR